MAEGDPFSQMFNLFAAPLAGTIQSFEQFRRGVEEFLRGVENFNRTMENLNETSERINGLLREVEEPLRAAVPQVTRAVKAADDLMRVVSGPAMAVAPGLAVLAEALNNPALKQMPHQLTQMNEMLSEVTTRLAPLGQLAESAGGLFGFKLPGFGAATRPTPAKPEPAAAPVEYIAPTKKAAAKKKPTPRKKTTARKKTAARKKPAAEKR